MSNADREAIAMANRPRERMDRMERAAQTARGRKMMRWAKRQEIRARWMHIRKGIEYAVGAAVVALMSVGITLILVVG